MPPESFVENAGNRPPAGNILSFMKQQKDEEEKRDVPPVGGIDPEPKKKEEVILEHQELETPEEDAA
jgi:hypothetical protein